LLLLTNDGELAAQLTHPRHGVERTYEAHVAGVPDESALRRLRDGIPLDGRKTLPATVDLLSRPSKDPSTRGGTRDRRAGEQPGGRAREREGVLLVTIREGRNRQVRRMCEAIGHPVRRLKRTTFGPIADRRLRPGEWRDLSAAEVAALQRAAAGTAPRAERGRPSRASTSKTTRGAGPRRARPADRHHDSPSSRRSSDGS
jgi:23S rRNA pseudouridine2605 synthase